MAITTETTKTKEEKDKAAAAASARSPRGRRQDEAEETDAPRNRMVPVEDLKADYLEKWRRERGEGAVELLLEACDRYGINPDQRLPKFNPRRHALSINSDTRELAAWAFYAGENDTDVPDSVVLVTEGGFKLRYARPVDLGDRELDVAFIGDQTETQLRQALNAYQVDPKTRQRIPAALPEDLALPFEALKGFSPKDGAQMYRRGYLREGGKTEAERRARAPRPADKLPPGMPARGATV